jgi:hypothetical protein
MAMTSVYQTGLLDSQYAAAWESPEFTSDRCRDMFARAIRALHYMMTVLGKRGAQFVVG